MNKFPPTPNERTRLRDRYELLEEVSFGTGGRHVRARDLAFAEIVGVKYFQPNHTQAPSRWRELQEFIRYLQCLAHPHLVRLYSLDSLGGWLIHEWVQGISLLDLLRRRRGLPVVEVLRILAPLPGTLDFLANHAVTTPRPLLSKLFIQVENPAATDFAAPIEQWPPFILKLSALSLREWSAAPSMDDTTHFVIPDPRQPSEISAHYGPKELSRLLYELLGGRIRELDMGRYSPVAALGEAGNAVLHRSLCAMPHTTCEDLWQDLLNAQPEFRRHASRLPAKDPAPADRPLRIPESLLAKSQPATVLCLDPTDRGGTPIRLVARPRFKIGRSPQQADFITRILPENETNNGLTNRLSRVHSILEWTGSELSARDGNGKGPSLNGSFLNGDPLTPDPPTRLRHRSLLWLGEEYAVELIPVYAQGRLCPAISNLDAWCGPKESAAGERPCGGVVCLAASGEAVVRHAAWIFTEVGFGLDAAEQLVWDIRGRSISPGAFHHHAGQFWLSNRSLPETTLACDETPLQRNEIVPLTQGQVVRMGSHGFTVRLE